MNTQAIRRIHSVTAFITLAAVVFYLFFQINKGEPFRDINPFAVDPYDAVGSFAIQIALLIGILTYARALRLRDAPSQVPMARLILRGNLLVVLAILVILSADAVAEVVSPLPASYWGNVLRAELALVFALAAACIIALAVLFAGVKTPAPPRDLTPADGIDDLWTLVRVPVTWAGAFLPSGFVAWVRGFNSDRLFRRLQWLNPRTHPWRFAGALGLLVGVALASAQLQEGLPANLRLALLVAGIFIGAEFGATLLGYAVLGAYLGLRPGDNK